MQRFSLGTAAGLVSLCAVFFALSGSAGAAPIQGFDVTGAAGQTIAAIEPGTSGSVWVQQKLSDSSFQLRQFSATGESLVTSPEIASAVDGPIAPAADGSVWVAAGWDSVVRVSPQGTVGTFSVPGVMHFGRKIAVDQDSNAWVVGYTLDPETMARPSHAIRITPSGETTSTHLPDFDMPNGIHGLPWFALEIIPVEGGVWIGLDSYYSDWGASGAAIAFVNSSGVVTQITPDSNMRLVAAAPDGKAWWMRWTSPSEEDDRRTMLIGQVTQDANVLPASTPIEGDFFTTPPLLGSDANGDLVFAFNHTPTEGWAGDFTDGVARVQGIPALTNVISPARRCVTFYHDDGCEYVDTIHRTADGAIWTLADPDERQAGRLAANGTWTRFSPLTGTSEGIAVKGMTQSTDGAIWFALEQAGGAHTISRANPADPPADETPTPEHPTEPTGPTSPAGGGTGGTVGSKSVPKVAATQDELDAIAEAVRDGVAVWRAKKFSPKVAIQYPRKGRLDITIKSGKTVLAKVAKSHAGGSNTLKIKLGTAGRKLLKRKQSLSAKIIVVFSSSGHKQASLTLRVRL